MPEAMISLDQHDKFKLGDRVRKISGSEWHGHVVGAYSTPLTPEGYCIKSERETNSVQNYPAAALEFMPAKEDDAADLAFYVKALREVERKLAAARKALQWYAGCNIAAKLSSDRCQIEHDDGARARTVLWDMEKE